MSIIYLDQQQLKKRRRTFIFKIVLIVAGISALIAGLIYAVAYSPIFQIDNFIVENNNRLTDETALILVKSLVVNGFWADFLGEKNLFIWPDGALNVSGTPLLAVTIDKNWLNRNIKIYIEEREQFGIWCIQNDICYWLDQNGLAFEEAPETEGTLILKISDLDRQESLLGQKVAEDRFLNNLLALADGLKKIGLPIQKTVFDRELQELRSEIYNGPEILFSVRFDPKLSLNSLKSLLETLDLNKTSYIDLRVENRIFYKT